MAVGTPASPIRVHVQVPAGASWETAWRMTQVPGYHMEVQVPSFIDTALDAVDFCGVKQQLKGLCLHCLSLSH